MDRADAGQAAGPAQNIDPPLSQPPHLSTAGVAETMKLRQAGVAATFAAACTPTSRAPWAASPGRSSVFDATQAQ